MDNKKTLNLYSERCTPILIKVEKLLKSMSKGDILVVNCDNACALKKIRSLCYERDYFVELQRIDKYAMRYIIKL